MSIRSHRLGALCAAGALLTAGLLSGCSVSDQQLRPGVAAQVGDTEVSMETIDEAIEVACGYFVDEEQTGFPRSLARQQFVNALVQRAAASQSLEEQGLDIGDDYEQAAGSIDVTNSDIPVDQRPPFVLLNEATTYVDAAAAVLGEASYGEEGEVPADPALLIERGAEVISDWFGRNDVDINPVFRLTVEDGQVVSESAGTSVAASDFASTTLLDPLTATPEQVNDASAQLPASQLCGVPAEA